MENPGRAPPSPLALEDNLRINLSNGVDETIHKMANAECVFEKTFTNKDWSPPKGYSVLLEIQSPPSKGQIRFHFPHIVLSKLYQNIMNETTNPNGSQVMDCLAEISNVTYGLTKIKLNQEGFNLNMALPFAGKTEDIPGTPGNKTVIPFKVFDETCFIEVVILAAS